jgi:hypothetical protein
MIKVDQYTAVKIEQNEQYGVKLLEGWTGRDGDFKPNFCEREFKKGSGKKNVPVSIKLGDKAMAETVLLQLLTELTGNVYFVREAAPF